MKKLAIAACSLFLFSVSSSYAIDCNTDCGKFASFRYPCPTFGNPGRKCTGRDPVKYSTCETAKQASCKILKPVIKKIGQAIGKDSRAQKRAKDDGWTKASCLTHGTFLVGTVGLIYQTPICAAVSVGAGACLGYIAVSSPAVTSIACTQLCQDRKLNDCR